MLLRMYQSTLQLMFISLMVSFGLSLERRLLFADTVTDSSNMTGVSDVLFGRLTAGLSKDYLQALTELYTNFHGQLRPRSL